MPPAVPQSQPATSYCWPVSPFDQPHPVRGNLGDPRMVFNDPPIPKTVLTGGGSFQFHFGVDVSDPDGTSAFPVLSGKVTHFEDDWIEVDVGGGRSFQYWHLVAAVKVGQQVQARTTVLGDVTAMDGDLLRAAAAEDPTRFAFPKRDG